jgi:hypothetical protein
MQRLAPLTGIIRKSMSYNENCPDIVLRRSEFKPSLGQSRKLPLGQFSAMFWPNLAKKRHPEIFLNSPLDKPKKAGIMETDLKGSREVIMRSVLKRLSVPAVLLLVLSLATFANAGPHRRPGHHGGKGGGCEPPHSVAEPATLALLGAGLVSIGLYSKRKR